MARDYEGFLITVEGIDKAGKTTVVSAIRDVIEDDTHRNIIVNTEPDDGSYGYGNEFGNLTREKLSDESVHPLSLFHLFESDHYQHIEEVVKPALERGDIVVLDRYFDSRYAYQTVALEKFFESEQETLQWIQTVQEKPSVTPTPDLTLYIEISAEESARRGAEDDNEVFEKSRFQEAARENYDMLSRMYDDRFVTIDGMQPPSSVRSDSVDAVKSLIRS